MATYESVIPINTLISVRVMLNGEFLNDDDYVIKLQSNEKGVSELIVIEVNKK